MHNAPHNKFIGRDVQRIVSTEYDIRTIKLGYRFCVFKTIKLSILLKNFRLWWANILKSLVFPYGLNPRNFVKHRSVKGPSG